MPDLSPSEILLSTDQIQKRVAELAQEIRRDFPGDLHLIAVLKGAFIFLSDLLRNIEHRRQTIYRVVESIVHRQRAFLDHGVQFIKPMMLKDIAEDIGMHLSTVSRVVNRKYAHTPQGVIELRRFFTEGMLNEDGEEISTRIIKLKIKKLIEEEDSHNPITDDQVVKILVKDGIKLSRRTVAKYRDQMNIPGSRERRAVL